MASSHLKTLVVKSSQDSQPVVVERKQFQCFDEEWVRLTTFESLIALGPQEYFDCGWSQGFLIAISADEEELKQKKESWITKLSSECNQLDPIDVPLEFDLTQFVLKSDLEKVKQELKQELETQLKSLVDNIHKQGTPDSIKGIVFVNDNPNWPVFENDVKHWTTHKECMALFFRELVRHGFSVKEIYFGNLTGQVKGDAERTKLDEKKLEAFLDFAIQQWKKYCPEHEDSKKSEKQNRKECRRSLHQFFPDFRRTIREKVASGKIDWTKVMGPGVILPDISVKRKKGPPAGKEKKSAKGDSREVDIGELF